MVCGTMFNIDSNYSLIKPIGRTFEAPCAFVCWVQRLTRLCVCVRRACARGRPRPCAEGAYGVVCAAKRNDNGEKVAIKKIGNGT